MASLISFAPASFLSVICLLSPASAFAALSQQTLAPYAEGLDAMNEGRWPDAVSAFSRALEVSGDDPDIVLARGVARTLAEDFPRALKPRP
jgi:Flp pilus assembly protein TadD